MNLKKLKQAEEEFFNRYPGGFANPEMIAIRKKHKLDKMMELTQDSFARRNFKLPELIVENMIKIVTRSSLISVFEKPNSGTLLAHSHPKTSRHSPRDWKNYCMETNNSDSKPCWKF